MTLDDRWLRGNNGAVTIFDSLPAADRFLRLLKVKRFNLGRHCEHGPFAAGQALADLLDEFVNLRRSTVHFFAALSPEALARAGTANNNRIVVRAIPYITAGHAAHHLEVLRTRYLTP